MTGRRGFVLATSMKQPIDVKQFRPKFVQEALGDVNLFTADRFCLKCPTKLGPHLRFYCSGYCVMQAKMDGTYGKESAEAVR